MREPVPTPEGRVSPSSGQAAARGQQLAGPATAAELSLLAALRNGEERAFATLLDQHHAALLRLAKIYVPSHAVAEEVVQETWLGVLQGLHNFEGRSSLKSWIFRILVNRAKTRAQREGRNIPFSSFSDPSADPDEPSVDPSRFLDASDPEWPGDWVVPPKSWGESPEQALLSSECRAQIQNAIEALPPSQREVITLRDIQGWTTPEVCDALGISETNVRVLLHRARSKVRQKLENYFHPKERAAE